MFNYFQKKHNKERIYYVFVRLNKITISTITGRTSNSPAHIKIIILQMLIIGISGVTWLNERPDVANADVISKMIGSTSASGCICINRKVKLPMRSAEETITMALFDISRFASFDPILCPSKNKGTTP